MAAKKKKKDFLLRLDPKVHAALQRWASDELRSLNGHIEYLLREALRKERRLKEER
ncbi:MAG: type II toxin-antitoxin system antitoxin [Planctomycetota bacterium]